MLCEKCGKQLKDGETICPDCAAKGINQSQDSQNSSQNEQGITCPSCGIVNQKDQHYCTVCGTPLIQESQNIDANQQDSQMPNDSDNSSLESPKKRISKKAKTTICSIIAAAVVCIGATTWAFWPQISDWWNNTFTKPGVQSEDSITYNIAKTLTKMKNIFTNGTTMSSEFEFDLGDQFAPMIEDFSGTDISFDIDWLKSVSINADVSMKGSQMKMAEKLQLNGTELLDFDYAIDYSDMSLYVGFPSYQSQYLKIASELSPQQKQEMQAGFSGMQTVLAALPDEITIQNTLDRYIDCAVSAAGTVDKSETTLTVDDVSQSVTVSSTELNEQDAYNIVKALIAEAKNDETVKTFVNEISSLTGATADDYTQVLADAEKELEEISDFSDDTTVTISVYTDSKDRFVGWELDVDGKAISYYTVTDGDEIGVKFQLPISTGMADVPLEFSGTGTVNKGKIDGEFDIKAMGMSFVTFEAENYAKDGSCGSVTVRLNQMVTAMLPDPASKIADLSLKFSWATISETEGTAEMALYYKDGLAISYKGHATEKAFQKITYPTNAVTLESTLDEEALSKWAEGFNMEKLFSNLTKAGVPAEYVDMIEQSFLEFTPSSQESESISSVETITEIAA